MRRYTRNFFASPKSLNENQKSDVFIDKKRGEQTVVPFSGTDKSSYQSNKIVRYESIEYRTLVQHLHV